MKTIVFFTFFSLMVVHMQGQSGYTGFKPDNSKVLPTHSEGALIHHDAQKNFLAYNLNIHYGAMLPHYPVIQKLNNENIRGLELLTWFRQPKNMNPKAIPVTGVGYYFSNLGNHDVLGNTHALSLNLMSTLGGDRLPIHFKAGLGIAYATQKHDPKRNPQNPAIGSHINAYGRLSLGMEVLRWSNKWILTPGVSFHHISNGSVVSPNQGLNLLTFHVGMEFHSSQSHSGSLVLKKREEIEKKNRLTIMLAAGIKQVHRTLEDQIVTSSLIIDYGYPIAAGTSMGLGLNLFYNDTWAQFPYFYNQQHKKPSPFQSAVHIGFRQDIGPLSLIVHPGIYILKPSEQTPWFTNRLGLKYTLPANFTAQFSIKHHWFALADYFEWGIGYNFNW